MQGAANSLEIVCYPYLRRQLATKRRGFLGNIFARIKVNPSGDNAANAAIASANLDNKFVEFEAFQGSVAAMASSLPAKDCASLFGNVDIMFSPCANGRPPVSGLEAIDYGDSREYLENVAGEKMGEAGQLFRLPPMGKVLEHNLCALLASPHLVPKQNLNSTSTAHFLHSGSADFQWTNWDANSGFSFQTGNALDDKKGGWKNLEALQVHDTAFFIHDDTMHAGLYLGGKMILHKPSSDSPLWISTFREILDLGGGRWSDVHVKRDFNPAASKKFEA